MIYENVIQTLVMIYRYRRAKINSSDKVEKWKKEEFRAGLTGLSGQGRCANIRDFKERNLHVEFSSPLTPIMWLSS
jgi:hypothetical protein